VSFPAPDITPVSAPYWDGLKAGRLLFQRCLHCGHRWLPPREACPQCLTGGPAWEESAGRGTVVSWVVYHVAYNDAFKNRIPYDVTLVELDEGPRLLTNIVDSKAGKRLAIGAAVHLKIEREGDLALARFSLDLVDPSTSSEPSMTGTTRA
jgi:uncharacterized OB-fold protein